MAQSKNIKSAEFDSIVIGGGLSGLIAAHQLESTGRKVALVEGLDTLGGNCRPTRSIAGTLDHGLKFIPANEASEEALRWLSSILGEELSWELVEAPPVTYDDGRFKPFVGFGEQKVETAAEVDAYAKGRYLRLRSTPKDWVQKLGESFAGTLLPQSHVTKMHVDDHFVINVIVNGAKHLSAREIVFCATPQQLVRLLPEGTVPARLRQKLIKGGDFWTSVNLDLIHIGSVTESQAVHVLKGANEEPCVGLFHPPTTLEDGRAVQVSQWLTLVHRDITDDAEAVGSALKQIKRQVKRAYETALDGLAQERIAVSPTSHGDLTGVLSADGKWPKLENLWVISSFQDSEKNIVGAIRQARRTLATLVGEPVTTLDTDTDLHESPQPTA